MNQDEFDALDARIRARADSLWADAGRPEGGSARYLEQARELVAIEEVEPPTLDPVRAAAPVIEEAAIQDNLGEFPTLRDQGDEMTHPDPDALGDPAAGDDLRPSDGDASATGGVLPEDGRPEADLPEVSVADADITTSGTQAGDAPPNDDLNDDGMPDATRIDGTAEGGGAG